ncbi:MAG: Putative manganese efflux pump MntP [uncultured Caballeronia sp.]|nr:MAG: Putative manganese efflux pump MntP [uncultured Caballeronia sp.]
MCRGDRSGSPDLNGLTTTHIPMNIASTLLLAFAMSTDAFAAAVGKGATLHPRGFARRSVPG